MWCSPWPLQGRGKSEHETERGEVVTKRESGGYDVREQKDRDRERLKQNKRGRRREREKGEREGVEREWNGSQVERKGGRQRWVGTCRDVLRLYVRRVWVVFNGGQAWLGVFGSFHCRA